jgi:hypothetical protein
MRRRQLRCVRSAARAVPVAPVGANWEIKGAIRGAIRGAPLSGRHGTVNVRHVAVRMVSVRWRLCCRPSATIVAVSAQSTGAVLSSGAAVIAIAIRGPVARVCAVGVGRVAVRRVTVRSVTVRIVAVRIVAVEAKEVAAAACAHALRGGGGGGGGGGGLLRCSHRSAQLEEEEENKREHRAARCECGRHSYLREVLGRKRGRSCWTSVVAAMVCERCEATNLARLFRIASVSQPRDMYFYASLAFVPASLAFSLSFIMTPVDERVKRTLARHRNRSV